MSFADEKKFFLGGVFFGGILATLLTCVFIFCDPHHIPTDAGSPGEVCFPNNTCYEGMHCGEIPELRLKHVCLENDEVMP